MSSRPGYYHTPGWDDVFIKILNDSGGGIAYGNDTIQKENMPTTSVISGDIVRALGWLQMPTLTHLYGDEVWKHIGNELKILHYVPEVIIEHNHWFKNKELIDDIYLKTNSTEMYNIDRIAFTEWKVKQSKTDIETIKGVLDGTNINKT